MTLPAAAINIISFGIDKPSPRVKPLGLWKSLLFFWVPSLYSWLAIYGILPRMIGAGISTYWSFMLVLTSLTLVLFVSSLVAFRLEGNPLTWAALKERFRLTPIRGSTWLWLALLIAMIPLYVLLREGVSKPIAQIPALSPPGFLPAVLDPRVSQTSIPTMFMDIPMRGAWFLLPMQLVTLFFNIYGEEFWWRGYILPRQEKVFGKWTWLVHGLLWASFHSFWWWDVPAILPGALLVSFVAQKTRSTTPGIVWHWVNNGLTLVVLAFGILGLSI